MITHKQKQLTLAKQQSSEVQIHISDIHRSASERDRSQLDIQMCYARIVRMRKIATNDGGK